jgi:hypothetical protein
VTWASVQRASDLQVHALGERAQDLYSRAAVISRLPQDRSALAQALYKEAEARCTLAEARSNDSRDRSEAVEVLGKPYARLRKLAACLEPFSQVPCTRAPVPGRGREDRCPSVADRYARSASTGVLAPPRGDFFYFAETQAPPLHMSELAQLESRQQGLPAVPH